MAVLGDYAGVVFRYGASSSLTTHSATTTRAVAVGEVLVLFASGTGSNRVLESVSDAGSNTWTIDRSNLNGTTVNISVAVCTVTTAISSGTTISMTFGANVNHSSQCHGFTGVTTTGRTHTGGTLASSSDPTVPGFASTGAGLQIAGLASGGSQSGGVTATGFNSDLGYIQGTGTIRGMFCDWIPLTGDNSIAHNPNGTTARIWAYNIMFLPDAPATGARTDGHFF